MNTKQLKQKILDLAIRGKLAPQDPNDESATVLLERIRAEKERFIKEKKIKKERPLRPIEDEKALHQLPTQWVWCKLGELAIKVGSGSTPRGGQSVYKTSGVKFIRSQNIYNNRLNLSDIAHISNEINEQMQGTVVKPRDILLNITGASIGRSALVPSNFDCGNVNQHVSIIRSSNADLHPYIHKVITSDFTQSVIKKVQVGAAQEGLPADKQKELLIPLPPLAEQRRIVAAIDSAFAVIDEIERNKTDLQTAVTAAKQKILSLAIQGKLVPQDPNDELAEVVLARINAKKEQLLRDGRIKRNKKTITPINNEEMQGYLIPESWTIARLDEICQLITDGTHQTPKYADAGFVFLSSKNVKSGKIDWDNIMYIPQELHDVLYARLAPELGDILLAKNGTTGFAAVVDKDCIFDIYVSLALIRTFKDEISPEYLRHIISSEVVQSHFRGNLKGIGVPNLHLEHIRSAIIPICSLAEQRRIVAAIESAFTQLDNIAEMLS